MEPAPGTTGGRCEAPTGALRAHAGCVAAARPNEERHWGFWRSDWLKVPRDLASCAGVLLTSNEILAPPRFGLSRPSGVLGRAGGWLAACSATVSLSTTAPSAA